MTPNSPKFGVRLPRKALFRNHGTKSNSNSQLAKLRTYIGFNHQQWLSRDGWVADYATKYLKNTLNRTWLLKPELGKNLQKLVHEIFCQRILIKLTKFQQRGTEIRNFPKILTPTFFNSILKRRSKNPPGRNFTNFYSLEIF